MLFQFFRIIDKFFILFLVFLHKKSSCRSSYFFCDSEFF